MTDRRQRQYEKRVEPRAVTYRLTRYASGIPIGIELCVTRIEYDEARTSVARRLARARARLRATADSLATAPKEYA